MKGIVYIRVSSDEQVLGTSLAFQEEICLKYCAEHRIDVIQIFREEGASAKTAKRPELLRAIEFCRKNRPSVQALVVAKVDRFARNTEDHFAVRAVLKRYGVSLRSVTEPIGNSPTERLLETILAGSAEFDNAVRTQRSTDGMKSQLRRGIWPWKVPIGYLCAGTKRRGLKKTEPDPIDEIRFPLIQRGLQVYASGGIQSLAKLASFFNSLGLTSVEEKRISVQMVDRMLGKHLAFYAGMLMDPFSGVELPGRQQPMITGEEWRRIRMIRSGKVRSMTLRDRDVLAFPLRRTVLCASCNRPLTASSPRGHRRRYPYYHCATKTCERYGRSFPQKQVEENFDRILARVKPQFRVLVLFVRQLVERTHEVRKQFLATQKKFGDRVLVLQSRRERVFEMREDGTYTKEQFVERHRAINSELDQTLNDLNALQDETAAIGPLVRDSLEFVRDLVGSWRALSTQLKRRFQRVVLPAGILYDSKTGFGTPVLGSFFTANQEFARDPSRFVTPDGTDWNAVIADIKELRAIYDEWKHAPPVPEQAEPQ